MTVTTISPELGERQNEFNLHKFDQLKSYAVRDLDCGIPARLHPDADEISRQTHEWLRDFDMHTLFDAKTFERFVKMDCPRVLSMTHPDSPFDGTLWIARLVTMFFVADDYLEVERETRAPGADPVASLLIEMNLTMFWSFPRDSNELIAHLLARLESVPDYRKSVEELCHKVVAEAVNHPFGTAYPEHISPCAAGFRDLWQQAITVMPKEWGLRQAKAFNSYLGWHIKENFNCKQRSVPTMDEYVIHRTGSGGMQMLLGCGADFVDRNPNVVPDNVFYTDVVKRLLDAGNLASCLFNDIYSFPKELRNGEYHNMVFLVSYWQNVSYVEAAERVMKMVENINRDIVITSDEMSRTMSPEHRIGLQSSIDACVNSIPAHNVFHKTSYRYAFNKPLVELV